MVLDQVSFWHGWVERRRRCQGARQPPFCRRHVRSHHPRRDEKRAIAGITSLLTLWAGGRYGVTPVYQELPARPRSARPQEIEVGACVECGDESPQV